ILYGDYSLIRKGFEKSNLLVGERAHFRSNNRNGSHGNSLTQQRHRKHSPRASELLEGFSVRIVRELDGNIMDMNSLSLDHGSANRPSALKRYFRRRQWDRPVNRR